MLSEKWEKGEAWGAHGLFSGSSFRKRRLWNLLLLMHSEAQDPVDSLRGAPGCCTCPVDNHWFQVLTHTVAHSHICHHVLSHTITYTHTLSHTVMHSHTRCHALSFTLLHTHTLSHTQTRCHALTDAVTHRHILTRRHTHMPSRALTHTVTRCHTPSHALSHMPSHTLTHAHKRTLFLCFNASSAIFSFFTEFIVAQYSKV